MSEKKAKKSITQQNLEFQQKNFPARIEAVKKHAKAALEADEKVGKGHKPLSVKERGRHQKALRAAERVESRLKNPSGGKEGKPKAKKKAKVKSAMEKSEPRRRAVERATGMSGVTDRLRGLNELVKAGRKKGR